MGKIVIDGGITVKEQGDTLLISNIPQSAEYSWGLFSIKYKDGDTLAENMFPAGVWKKISNGETSYCLRDRGEGMHLVFVSFLSEKRPILDPSQYTARYTFPVYIGENDEVIIPEDE